MRAFLFIAVIGLVLAMPPLPAQAVTVAGGVSCGKWVKRRNTPTDEDLLHANQMWLLGYLSGAAVASQKDVLKVLEPEAIWLYVDKYCQANPLKHLDDAAAELYLEVVKDKGL